jgi:hypothetical protein
MLQSGMSLDTIPTPNTQRPEFFRLPSKGRDPHFGFSRSYYYSLESKGVLQMKRVRPRGAIRGITLVPYDAVSALIHRQGDRS